MELTIRNDENPKSPYKVKVQANKNYGICNILVGTKIPQEIVDKKTGKKKIITVFSPTFRPTTVLSDFQGRQYNDAYVMEHLSNILYKTLNTNE